MPNINFGNYSDLVPPLVARDRDGIWLNVGDIVCRVIGEHNGSTVGCHGTIRRIESSSNMFLREYDSGMCPDYFVFVSRDKKPVGPKVGFAKWISESEKT